MQEDFSAAHGLNKGRENGNKKHDEIWKWEGYEDGEVMHIEEDKFTQLN